MATCWATGSDKPDRDSSSGVGELDTIRTVCAKVTWAPAGAGVQQSDWGMARPGLEW